MPSQRALKPIFNGLVIAREGDYEEDWTDAKVEKWVALRDGRFSRDMDETVTHLLCSRDEFGKQGPRVKKALGRYEKKDGKKVLKSGQIDCYIVSQDWLFESIEKKRAVRVTQYLLSNILKEERKAKRTATRKANPKLFRTYFDSTFFEYQIILTRGDDDGPDTNVEKYILTLFESTAKPPLYQFAAKYLKKYKDPQPAHFRASQTQQSFATEFAHFQAFFKEKTGISWHKRLCPDAVPDREDPFKYQRPTGGKPVGLVDGMPLEVLGLPATMKQTDLPDQAHTPPTPPTSDAEELGLGELSSAITGASAAGEPVAGEGLQETETRTPPPMSPPPPETIRMD